MNRCSVCAREIPETKTVCDVCGRWAAEPEVAESHPPDPQQPTLPDIQPAAHAKVAYFPSPMAPVQSVEPAAPATPFAPVEPEAAAVPAAPAVHAAGPAHDAPLHYVHPPAAPAAPPAPTAKAAPSAKRAMPALGALKGRRGLVAGLGVAAMLAIAVLVARPAPPADSSAPAAPTVTPKPQAAKPKPSPVPQVEKVLAPMWNVNSKRWGANQKKSIAVELTALNRVQVWMRHVQPMLVVRCVAKSTEAFVFTDSPIAMEPDTQDHTVRLTFDNAPEQKELWPDSVEHDSLFAPDGAAFAQRLMTARTLQFGFTPHNSSAVVVQFQVNGLNTLVEPSAKDCGLK